MDDVNADMLMCILSMSCKHAGAPTVIHYSPTVPSYECTLPVLIFKIDYLPGYSQCQRGDHELPELQRGRSEWASSLTSRHRGCQIKIVLIMNDTNSINPSSGSDLCEEAELTGGRRITRGIADSAHVQRQFPTLMSQG